MLQKILKDYLSFSRKERRAVIILILLILCFACLPSLFPKLIKPSPPLSDSLKKEIASVKFLVDSAEKKSAKRYYRENEDAMVSRYEEKERPSAELFYFDPNTLEEEGWKKLGIRDRTVQTILKYRSKGGRFKKPEDIGKIYGLSNSDYERLLPYVRIEAPQQNMAPVPSVNGIPVVDVKQFREEKKKAEPIIIDINSADTTAFIALPGIGSYLARKIVTFRDKLGGFYSIDQVGETYNLPDSTFQLIKSSLVLQTPVYRQININTASFDELRAHPYIRYQLAKVFVQYREAYGPFPNVQSIRKIQLVTDEIYSKLAAYLKTN